MSNFKSRAEKLKSVTLSNIGMFRNLQGGLDSLDKSIKNFNEYGCEDIKDQLDHLDHLINLRGILNENIISLLENEKILFEEHKILIRQAG